MGLLTQSRDWTMELCGGRRVTRPPGVPDTMIAAMVLPDREIIEQNRQLKPGPPPRVFDVGLKATYGSLCCLGHLTNAAMLLQAYLQTLYPRLQGGTEELLRKAMEVARLLCLLQRDVARSNGRAMVQVCTSRRHLWLAQSRCCPEHICHSPHHPRADLWHRG